MTSACETVEQSTGLLGPSAVRLVAAVALVWLLAACNNPPDIIGLENPSISAADVDRISLQKVFIATTRTPSNKLGELYSPGRANGLGLASVTVTIPPNHAPGQLDRPRSLPPDPRSEFTVMDPVVYGVEQSFVRDVNAALAKRPKDSREILLFIHGYNTSTSDAVLRLAQFVHDSGFEGVPVLLSWASAAQPAKYVYDLNSALIARDRLPQIQQLLDRTEAESYDLLAHSMGSLLAMEGLVESSKRRPDAKRGRLQNVILAAPDIDIDLFSSQVTQLGDKPYNLFVLLSENDGALRISRLIAGGVPRVGSARAVQLSKFDVIVVDLSEVDDRSSASHSRFANSPEVVQLVGRGLNRVSRFDLTSAARRLDDILISATVRVLF